MIDERLFQAMVGLDHQLGVLNNSLGQMMQIMHLFLDECKAANRNVEQNQVAALEIQTDLVKAVVCVVSKLYPEAQETHDD